MLIHGSWGYALLCVAGPLAWGLLIVWAIERAERRIRGKSGINGAKDEDTSSGPEYHI